jgi:hypothetical protein
MSKRYSVRFGSTINGQKGPGNLGSSIIVNATSEKDAIQKAKSSKDYIEKRDSYKRIVRKELSTNEKMRLQHKATELKPKSSEPKTTRIRPLQQTGTQFRQNITVPRIGGLPGGGSLGESFRKIIKY